MSEDVPWETVTFGLGVAIFALAILKNLTDADSTWASYGFVALAGVARGRDVPRLGRDAHSDGTRCWAAQAPRVQLSRLTSSTRSSPGPS